MLSALAQAECMVQQYHYYAADESDLKKSVYYDSLADMLDQVIIAVKNNRATANDWSIFNQAISVDDHLSFDKFKKQEEQK